ncbi:MAG: SPFH domain-containing protein [Lachnospiraceae bacterium]|nr:SPFH domain-containing protein [Lachnospiraceae bacterium]
MGTGVKNTFNNVGERYGYGGNAPMDQRIYYFNVKEIVDNRFGTATPIPFRIVDKSLNLDIDVTIRCNGVYSFKIKDPIVFYTNVCGNVDNIYNKETIKNQMRNELMSAMQSAFGKLSNQGLRPNEIVNHCKELEELLNVELSNMWYKKRGVKISSISLSSVSLTEQDQNIIKEAQRNAMLKDTTMAAATLVGAQAEALKEAAKN